MEEIKVSGVVKQYWGSHTVPALNANFAELSYYEVDKGYATLAEADAAAVAANKTLILSKSWPIVGAFEFNSNVKAITGGMLTGTAANSVTFNGGFRADLSQHFSGGIEIHLPNTTVAYPQWYGVKTGVGVDYQTEMDRCIWSDAKIIHFLPGVYQSYVASGVSDRTFIFSEGSIIDGVIHLAVGNGPDIGGDLHYVENVRAIGTVASTVRVGTYYCKNVDIDKIRITDIDPSYVNQTVEGGPKGVHFFLGTHGLNCSEIIIENAVTEYALGINVAATLGVDQIPTDITVGRLLVRKATGTGCLQCVASLRTTIHEIVHFAAFGTGHINNIQNNDSLYIGKLSGNCTGASGSGAGVYSANNINSRIDEVNISYAKGQGFYNAAGHISVGKIIAHHNTLDGVRVLAGNPVMGKVITFSNTQRGVQIMAAADGTKIDSVNSYANTMDNIFIDSVEDVDIGSIIAHGSTSWGVFLNGLTRFKNRYMRSYSNAQGLRYIGNTDSELGVIHCSENTTDITTSGTNSGLLLLKLTCTTSSGVALLDTPGFMGIRSNRQGATSVGDADITLTVGVSTTTQRFGTTLTAARAVTLSTTGARNGDVFRIVRTTACTGAFSLSVGGLKDLTAAGQWCDVEYNGGIWVLTGYGTL